jgi:hypothetical protein
VNGEMTSKMDLVRKYGLMEHNTKESTLKEKNKEKGILFSLMRPNLREILLMEILMDLVNTYGLIVECIVDSGVRVKCTVTDEFFGKMEESMKDNTFKIKSMDLAYFLGQISSDTKDFGKKDFNMVSEFSQLPKEFVV